MFKLPEKHYTRGYGFVLILGFGFTMFHLFYGIEEFTHRGDTLVFGTIQQFLLYPLFGSMALLGASGLIAVQPYSFNRVATAFFKIAQLVFHLALVAIIGMYLVTP